MRKLAGAIFRAHPAALTTEYHRSPCALIGVDTDIENCEIVLLRQQLGFKKRAEERGEEFMVEEVTHLTVADEKPPEESVLAQEAHLQEQAKKDEALHEVTEPTNMVSAGADADADRDTRLHTRGNFGKAAFSEEDAAHPTRVTGSAMLVFRCGIWYLSSGCLSVPTQRWVFFSKHDSAQPCVLSWIWRSVEATAMLKSIHRVALDTPCQ
ncbi:unnamed protein product [Symbiodinium sp. KB8]|nr:unnamed protein product [Symbiodinium sp. KB8]